MVRSEVAAIYIDRQHRRGHAAKAVLIHEIFIHRSSNSDRLGLEIGERK